jgi:hypothetical protein
MKRLILTLALLLVPALLIVSGFYFEKDVLTSLGCIIFIFCIIMLIRGKFSIGQKENK